MARTFAVRATLFCGGTTTTVGFQIPESLCVQVGAR